MCVSRTSSGSNCSNEASSVFNQSANPTELGWSNRLCNPGARRSASTSTTRAPLAAMATPRLAATTLFPSSGWGLVTSSVFN